METLEEVKLRLLEEFISRRGIGWSVHGVTFKSPSSIENEDRMVIQAATICGQSWVLLAVLDGHSGPVTANYVSQRLPKYLRDGLRKTIADQLWQEGVDRATIIENAGVISKMLQVEIKELDEHIRLAVGRLFDHANGELTEEQALRLIDEHQEIIERAFQGTSIALALINVDHHLMWTAGLGTSTVALSIRSDEIGIRQVERLCNQDTSDVLDGIAARPSGGVDDNQRTLPRSSPFVTQVLGFSHMKCVNARMQRLFSLLPQSRPSNTTSNNRVDIASMPSYIGNVANASIRFVDYGALWDRVPLLMLYTNGVDRLVDGSKVRNAGMHSGADAAQVVSHLLGLSDKAKPVVEDILGHGVEIVWNPGETNRAVDILGNLLGGTDTGRLQSIIDHCRSPLNRQGQALDCDDTTVILCDLTLLREQLERIQGR